MPGQRKLYRFNMFPLYIEQYIIEEVEAIKDWEDEEYIYDEYGEGQWNILDEFDITSEF